MGAKQIRKHGVWFVDIPRTSSTSIKAELGIIYGLPYGKAKLINKQKWADKLPGDYIARMKHHTHQIFDDHIPAIEMQKIIGEKAWESLFTFTFVRNPWDRIISLYYTLKRALEIPGDMQFKEFVFALKNARKPKGESILRLREYYFGSSDYVLDKDGNILVKYIAKYENRNNDIKRISLKLGYEKFGTLHVSLSTPRDIHYSKYYDEETREVVKDIYKEDIELFDYEFES